MEDTDTPIPLVRAAEIAGLTVATLREQARRGKLQVLRYGHERLTTRRLLDQYLRSRDASRGGQPAPLPAGYVPPDAPAPSDEQR